MSPRTLLRTPIHKLIDRCLHPFRVSKYGGGLLLHTSPKTRRNGLPDDDVPHGLVGIAAEAIPCKRQLWFPGSFNRKSAAPNTLHRPSISFMLRRDQRQLWPKHSLLRLSPQFLLPQPLHNRILMHHAQSQGAPLHRPQANLSLPVKVQALEHVFIILFFGRPYPAGPIRCTRPHQRQSQNQNRNQNPQ